MAMRPRDWARSAGHVDLRRPAAPPRPATMDSLPQRVTIDLERTAIVVVDMQNDFCAPGGWLSSIGVDVSGAVGAADAIGRIFPPLRAADVPVIWLNWGNRPDRANLPPNVLHVYDGDGTGGGIGERSGESEAVLTRGSWGAALALGLEAEPEDVHVDKFRMSGFFDTPLDAILRARGIDTILFAGVNADQCVAATLMDAASLGYDVIMVEGASATTSPQYCYDATVYNVRQCFGFTVGTDELVAALTPAH